MGTSAQTTRCSTWGSPAWRWRRTSSAIIVGDGDEYEHATSLDPTLNGDGAVNGIDPDSIMGQDMTKVKRRHFRTICKHFNTMVKTHHGVNFDYEPVK